MRCPYEGLVELIGDDASLLPFNRATAKQTTKVASSRLSRLKPKYEDVLRLRFGVGEEYLYTLQAIADEYQLSRERVRQIQRRALVAIAHPKRKRRSKFLRMKAAETSQ